MHALPELWVGSERPLLTHHQLEAAAAASRRAARLAVSFEKRRGLLTCPQHHNLLRMLLLQGRGRTLAIMSVRREVAGGSQPAITHPSCSVPASSNCSRSSARRPSDGWPSHTLKVPGSLVIFKRVSGCGCVSTRQGDQAVQLVV